MTPTNRLRFVERMVSEPVESFPDESVSRSVKRRILQQWWEVENLTGAFYPQGVAGEWRDVPIEQEDAK
jgi:hypothetical protein